MRRRRVWRWRPAITILLAGAGIALVGGALWPRAWAGQGRVGVEEAAWGRLERAITAEALVVRGEEVVPSPISGRLRVIAPEGAQVSAGAPVAEVENPAARQAVRAELERTGAALASFRREWGDKLNGLRAEVADLEGRLDGALDEVRGASRAADVGAIEEGLKSLARVSTKIDSKKAELARLQEREKALIRARENLSRADRKAVVRLTAPSPGTVSYLVDGLEVSFQSQAIRSLRPADVRAALSGVPGQVAGVADLGPVPGGAPLFKIVDPGRAYLAVLVAPEDAALIRRNERVKVRQTGVRDREYEASVLCAVDAEAGEPSLVVLALSSLPQELLGPRKTGVEIIGERLEGTVVPPEAITVRDGSTGVYLVRQGLVHFVRATVKGRDRERAVLGEITPGSRVITTPWLVRAGQRVEQ